MDLFGSKNKVIWIGLRPISSKWNSVVIQIVPGVDVYDYAVRIRGIIYHITSASKFDIIKVLVDDWMSEHSFRWASFYQSNSKIPETNYGVRLCAYEFDGSKYDLWTSISQHFVKNMIICATGLSKVEYDF